MPLHPHAHRDLTGIPVTALVTPSDALARTDEATIATVYAESGAALYQLGTVAVWPDRAVATCCVRGCAWTFTNTGSAQLAAAVLAGHHGVEGWVAAVCGAEWARAVGL